jgi:Family of unknown function (DUF6065)
MMSASPARDADGILSLDAIQLPGMSMSLRPAPLDRAWMDTPSGRFAKRCLPLLIANQNGWEVLNPLGFRAMWDGGESIEAVQVWPDSPGSPPLGISHFGCGILTFTIPYLFRLPAGYNLLVRGPANLPKDGISALEGVVEADWTSSTFTMNWKFTRAGHPVRFDVGEPAAMIVPMRRGELERFTPAVIPAATAYQTYGEFERWSESRQRFLQDLAVPGSPAQAEGWQRDYMHGRHTDGSHAPAHQTRLKLARFETPTPASDQGKRSGS